MLNLPGGSKFKNYNIARYQSHWEPGAEAASPKINKSTGPYEILSIFLQGMTIPVTQALTRMNRASINQWQTPEEWKCANVSPIFKKGDKSRPSNYRLVFSNSVCCKDVEHIIHSDLMNLFKHHNILTDNQLRNKYPVIPNLYNNPGPHYGHKQQQSDWLLDLCSSAGCQLKCYGA